MLDLQVTLMSTDKFVHSDLQHKAPDFFLFVSLIYQKNPLQKKALQSFFRNCNDVFFKRAQWFAERILTFLKSQNLQIDYVVDVYLEMCRNMLIEQIKFKKTGKYSCQSSAQAHTDLYLSEAKMASYMYGLSLSQFLWPNHYLMYDFFIQESRKIPNIRSYLEIGPGHGLYLIKSILNFPQARFTAIDISPISNRISEMLVKHFTGYSFCDFQVQDVQDFEGGNFNYIVMCEVLEHLDDPLPILERIHGMLANEGRLFITTCANCPAIDHVYLYDSVAHIRQQLKRSGYEILADMPLAVGDYDEHEWEEKKVEINYAAMLKGA